MTTAELESMECDAERERRHPRTPEQIRADQLARLVEIKRAIDAKRTQA